MGAPNTGEAFGSRQGYALAFEEGAHGWTLTQRLDQDPLTPPVDDSYDSPQVALGGDRALVALPKANNENGRWGCEAFVFERSGDAWERVARLRANDPPPVLNDVQSALGWSVAFDGDRALLGAIGDSSPSGGVFAGAAFAFTSCHPHGPVSSTVHEVSHALPSVVPGLLHSRIQDTNCRHVASNGG